MKIWNVILWDRLQRSLILSLTKIIDDNVIYAPPKKDTHT